MWVYKETEHHAEGSLYTVGFYDPKGKWMPESDHDSRKDAGDRAAYLNGQNVCGNCVLRRSIDEALNTGSGVYKP